MKIFFDESGNSGCVVPNKKDDFFSDGQRFFVLCGVVVKDDADEMNLINKYNEFKKKFSISGELKGSDLLTREKNEELNYFLSNMLDDEHFYICIYDKIFYLASLVSTYIFTVETRNTDPILYYTQTSALALEDVSFFKKFCEAVAINTDKAKKEFLEYILDFDFKHIDLQVNGYKYLAKFMLDDNDYGEFPLPYGCYLNKNITNLINLTALGETLLAIKIDNENLFVKPTIVHDKIHEFEAEFIDTFKASKKINLTFDESKDNILIQYADNIASIFRKAFTKTVETFRTNKQWDIKNQYFPTLLSKILNEISITRCKFDTQISDWVLSLCVQDMFQKDFPKTKRNNLEFYQRFFYYKEKILTNIAEINYKVDL